MDTRYAEPIVRLANLILMEAIQLKATQVQLWRETEVAPRTPDENEEEDRNERASWTVKVRALVGWTWKELDNLPSRIYPAIVARFKVLAGLDLASHGLQVGSIPVTIDPHTQLPGVCIRIILDPPKEGEEDRERLTLYLSPE